MFAVFVDLFLDKGDNEIHYCGENTQNDRACHDEVEFEDLTAIDNEVSKSRFARKILAHDCSNPCEPNIDFQN